MSDFSSNAARSASVANTHSHCIHVILDCNLCIHYNSRFVVFIMLDLFIGLPGISGNYVCTVDVT